MHEDIEIIKSFKAGNHESFEFLINKYRFNAIAFAERYTRDPFIAEDIVQESFADIYVNREKYNEKSSFKTYLFTIIKNKSIDYLRKKKSLPLPDIEIPCLYTLEEEILSKEKNTLIKEKISKLKKDYQTAIYLIEYEDFSYEEAAKIMGRNLGQIKMLIYRARKKLKLMLEEEM